MSLPRLRELQRFVQDRAMDHGLSHDERAFWRDAETLIADEIARRTA
jgi:hypothetical protein